MIRRIVSAVGALAVIAFTMTAAPASGDTRPGGPAAVSAAFSSTSVTARTDFVRSDEYWLSQYGIQTAWKTTRGKGITIAVIDTGVDGTVPDLGGAVTGGIDYSGLGAKNGQKPVGPSDESAHGTMVASLAAGRGTGVASGVIGSAPDASILSISIGFGSASTDSDTQIAEAVRWAVDHGANIINMSLTRNTLAWPTSWDSAFLYAMQHNVVIIAAAGNRGSGTSEVGAPATMPGVLTVAGVDRNQKASVDASAQGITIGVSAPSEQLVGAIPGGGYVSWAGTSGATPIVSGIVALVMASHPGMDAANVINRVISTASDAGAPGADPLYGYGLVNAAAAVSAVVPTVQANPMGDLAAWIRLNRRAEPTSTPVAPQSPSPVARVAVGQKSTRNPMGTLYPSVIELRQVGLPLGIVAVFLLAFAVMLWRAIRYFRSLRRKG